MPSRPADTLAATARRLAWWSALLVTAIGTITLFGWATGIEGVSRLLPHSPRMSPNAALALALFGPALLCHARPPRNRRLRLAARAAGTFATVLSGAVAAEWILDVNLHVDALLFALPSHGSAGHPGRLSLTMCVALIGLGLALERDRRRSPTLLGLAPLVVGVVSLAGHASGVTAFTEWGGALRTSPPGAIALIAASAAVLLAHPTRGVARIFVSDGLGGLIARRMVPFAVALPIALDGARSGLIHLGTFSGRTADWAYASALVVVATVVVYRLARALDFADARRRAAEERLRHSEAQARSVTDTAHDAIVGADADGLITLFNPAAERLFGWTAAEVLGRPVTLLMPERYREGHRAGIRRLAAGGAVPTLGVDAPLELHGLTRAGREFDLELSLAHVDDGGGRRVIAIMRDISARKLLESLARDETARGARVVAAQSAIAEGAGELGPTLDLVAREARTIVGADGAVVELPDGDDMVYRAADGAGLEHLGVRVPIHGSLAGAVLATGETAVCHDTETDARVDREACRRIGVRSMICVALRHRGTTVAVLKVYSGHAGAFSERDASTLELLAGLAAATVHRAQVERRVAALHAVGEALAGAGSLEAGLAGALRGVIEQLGWGLGAVWLTDARDGSLACAETWHHNALAAGPYLALTDAPEPHGAGGLLDVVRRAGAPVWVERADHSPDVALDPRRANAAAQCGLRTLVAVPIVSRGETLGVVELACGQPRTHESATLDLLADVAAAVGQFVQRRRAEERITVQATNLAAVAELSKLLGRSDDPADTRPTLVRAIRDLARADSVLLVEPDGPGHLQVTAEAGGLVEPGLRLDMDNEEAVSIDVFRAGRGRFVSDFLDEQRVHDAQRRSGLRSAHYEPVMRDGVVAGVLVVATRELRAKDAGGVGALMRLLAGEAGTALALSDLLARLDEQARTDQLTGVANRRTWDHELPRELARARRTGEPLSLAMLDLDRFKAYNDAHGHPAGDRLLRGAAAAWGERLRTTDVLARYGGEEFVVLLPACDGLNALQVAEQLRDAVPGAETCSIGIATWDGAESADELVARADTALYEAKAAGRDRVVSAAV
ncbi:diguanylate cyclase [Baekduia sp. Peel2402]|uniref:diguanylate cyclase n=1 Tax=Baekduia sp. Peel2402 TaxID=3458296 RepID=UPI00403EBA59